MNLNVCIAGATGWIGKPLCLAVSESGDLSLVGAVSRTHEGRSLKDVFADNNLDVKISGSVAEALETPTDVLVDFTKADVVKANVMTAIGKGVHVVIGSSGLSDEDFVEIGQAALEHKVGVLAAGNFAITPYCCSALLVKLQSICPIGRFLTSLVQRHFLNRNRQL